MSIWTIMITIAFLLNPMKALVSVSIIILETACYKFLVMGIIRVEPFVDYTHR